MSVSIHLDPDEQTRFDAKPISLCLLSLLFLGRTTTTTTPRPPPATTNSPQGEHSDKKNREFLFFYLSLYSLFDVPTFLNLFQAL